MHATGVDIPKDGRSARIAIVEEHIRLENEHDLEGVLRTFNDTAQYDDEPWGEHYKGRNGVRVFYEQLMKALPDLAIEVQRRHVADDAVLVGSGFSRSSSDDAERRETSPQRAVGKSASQDELV